MSRWFTTRTWQDSLVVTAVPAAVAELFARPIEFLRLTPKVVSLDPIEGMAGGYRVTERIPMMGFHYMHHFKSSATLEGKDIITQAWSWPRILVRTRFAYAPHPEGTEITINTTLTSPSLIASFVINTAQQVRVELLDALKEKLESA